ncbi:DUF6896 domain-containing protein [Streptomyces sp. NPDC003444]
MSSAEACVASFLRCHEFVRNALAVEHPQFDSLGHVLEAVRAGELSRRGVTSEGFSYAVHGRGCRMTAPDGAEVDIDFLRGSFEAFDAWRLVAFARSVEMDPVPSEEDLVRECRELIRKGSFEEVEPGWFRPLGQAL